MRTEGTPIDSSARTPAFDQERPEPPIAGDELATFLGALDRQRSYIAWKCGGLDAGGLRATLGPSAITLGGLLKHMALIEDDYFSVRLLGHERAAPFNTVDWKADPEWEWRTAADDNPEDLFALWADAVTCSRAVLTEVLNDGGLGQLARSAAWSEPPSLRRLLIDLIEEYARHVGHADLIREAVDGLVGEDPPE